MKKFCLMLLFLILGVCAYADSKSCSVNGASGSVLVNAYVSDSSKGKVIVNISNSSDEYVNVEFTVSGNNVPENRGKIVPPQSEVTVEIIKKSWEGAGKASVDTISADKCK